MILELNGYERHTIRGIFPERASFEEGLACQEIVELTKLTSKDFEDETAKDEGDGVLTFSLKMRKPFEFSNIQFQTLLKGVKTSKNIPTDPIVIALGKRVLELDPTTHPPQRSV